MTARTLPADSEVQPAEPAPAWEETPAQVRRADSDYWVDRDWPTEPDDPSDHYNH